MKADGKCGGDKLRRGNTQNKLCECPINEYRRENNVLVMGNTRSNREKR